MSPDREARPKNSPPTALPTGTVTFLFSDIEGSTQRWEAHPEAMKAAVARHERIVNDAIARHGGYVFKLVGDAFCAAFQSAPGAIAAACDAQRDLVADDFSDVDGLSVRIGLHTGQAEERNGDYFGPAVNRVARLASLGFGGQTLISDVTHDLSRDALPAGVSLLDLGSHRLKDLTEPEQIWQVNVAGLRAQFPALKSLDAVPNNLPIQPTSFRGREHDLEEVKTLLGQHRLVTLFGSGGVGKTRLAQQAGAELLDRYPDGVWFADLAAITDPELVSSVIAKTVGMEQTEGQRVDSSIPQWLKRKQLLLILDNCEHLLEAVAPIADGIIRNCLDVRMLATSRQALGIGGEEVLQLPSLDVPHSISDLTPEAVVRFGAVALFVDRARSVDKSFRLTDDTAPIVADICRRLDGIPLAIELAAARVKVLSVPNLAQRLNDRFKILTGGSRTALPRQKTLGALIDWSYDLLTPQEQMLFTRVSIFAGGFSLDAATAVCGGDGLDEIDVLDLLSSLTDKSLVVAETGGEQERYRMLESARAYALEKLVAAGDRERMARRHAEYFRDRAMDADRSYGIGSTNARIAGLELELDNYRAALEWSLADRRDAVVGGEIAGALTELWSGGGLAVEGRYWIDRGLTAIDEAAHPRVAAMLLVALGGSLSARQKLDVAERAIALFASVGDEDRVAWATVGKGYALYQMGRYTESEVTIERALEMMRACGDAAGVAQCLNNRCFCRENRYDLIEGRLRYTQAIEAYRALGNESGMATILGNLAELEFWHDHADVAQRLGEESLAMRMLGKNAEGLSTGNANLVAYRAALGDTAGAKPAAREGLRWGQRARSGHCISVALQHLAMLGAMAGDAQAATRLIGYVDFRLKVIEFEREATERWGYEKLMAALREHLSADEIERLAAEGAAWSEDKAIEEALKF